MPDIAGSPAISGTSFITIQVRTLCKGDTHFVRDYRLGRVENQKFLNFNPGHVDSDVTHKNNEENAKKSSFRLKTYC